MAKVLVNRAKVLTSTTGTGAITLGTAIAGFQSFSDAGVQNGDVVRYVIEDGEYWELGTGTYTASGTTLSRNVVESSNSDNAINLSGNALVFVTADASDYVQIDGDVMTGDLTVTNIITSGNVDGRDVSVDGTKLDGIEANATADQTKSDIDALNINADTLDGQHGSYYTAYTDTAVGNMAATFTVFEYTATAGQTAFSGSDENGNTMAFVAINTMVTMNGIILDPSDYTVTSTTTITLDVGAAVDDVLNVIAFTSFTTADTATSAQGNTADAALPRAGGAMTGAITTNSTFDGRDVATDGTKLDGIETGATADQTASEIKALVESASDSNVFTDADHTKLNAIEASADVTDTANVVAALIAGTNITIAANGTITSTDTNTTYSIQDGELSQNNFTNADHSKLDGIEAGATADQTAAQIKVAYESNSDTNEFSDAEQTKLSNIEANATADQTAAEIKTLVGSATDSNVFTDADHTKLDGIETAATADQTKADIEGLGIDVPATNLTGTIPAARLSTATTQAESDDSTKIATTAYVVDKITTLIGGAPSTLNDLNELAAAINDDANYNTTLTTALATKLPLAGGTMTGDVLYNDNVRAKFGAGSDLSIYHETSTGNSRIVESGTGNLNIEASNLNLKTPTGENYINCNDNGSVLLRYDNAQKLETTTTGIDVTGAISIDNTTGSPDQTLMLLQADLGTNDRNMQIKSPTSDSASAPFRFTTGNSFAFEIDSTTDALVIDASANVGIGTATPATALDVVGTVTADGLRVDGIIAISSQTPSLRFFETDQTDEGTLLRSAGDSFQIAKMLDTGATDGIRIRVDQSSGNISFYDDTGVDAKFHWDASAESLGIGTTSPSVDLEIGDGSGTSSLKLNSGTTDYFQIDSTGTVTNLIAGNSTTGAAEMAFYSSLAGTESERMRIDSSGNVGIGTSSPAENLHIETSGSTGIQLRSGTSSDGFINFNDGATARGQILYSHNGDYMRMYVNASEAMRINSSGRVGIGTSSPTRTFHVNNATGLGGMKVQSGGTSDTFLEMETSTNRAYIGIDESLNVLKINNTATLGSAVHMSIDTAGNVFVARTAEGDGNVGHTFRADGFSQTTRSGGLVADFNRKSSDGDIVRFQKDGTSVGTIGNSGSALYIESQGNSGAMFYPNAVLPIGGTSGTLSNGAVDLGRSGNKFKDGHFSGNLYGDGSNLTGVGGSTTVGAVGTYAALQMTQNGANSPGHTRAGSGLKYMNFFAYGGAGFQNVSPSGTWRLMGSTGYYQGGVNASTDRAGSVWLRIS